MIMVFENFGLRGQYCFNQKTQIMKKSLDVKGIKNLKNGIKKVRSKSHCKLFRNGRSLFVLCEVNVFLEKIEHKKSRRKKYFCWFFKTLKFIAKLLKTVAKLFSL